MSALLERVATRLARQFPSIVWSRYARAARACGIDRLYFVLSFDCDTPEDAAAASRVHDWLSARAFKATYAVPGSQLAAAAATYRRIADEGGDFINHGALPHAEWRGTRYWSVTFYHEMSAREVTQDIADGHRIVADVVGRAPSGFRAPHFGLFQGDAQLRLMHAALRDLGYRYSTSTVPSVGVSRGPVVRLNGIREIPVSGSWDSPLVALDSWGRIESPERPEIDDSYADAMIETVDRLLEQRVPGVLNYYVDPAHVHRRPAFYRAIEHVIASRIPSLHYDDLLKLVPA